MLDEQLAHFLRRDAGRLPAMRAARSAIMFGCADQLPVDPLDVLGVVRKVHADERRVRMPRDDAFERGQQFLARRIFIAGRRTTSPDGP